MRSEVYSIEPSNIYCMDCLEGMRQMESGSMDLIATDPPYKLTSRGGTGNMSGYWTTKAAKDGKVFDNNDIEIEEYLSEFYRVLKADAHCYIMCNNTNLPHFFEIIGKSQFHFVKLLVWDKQTKICGTYYMGQVEFIFLLRKGKDKHINNCGTSDLISFANKRDKKTDGSNIHNSQKPIGLMATLIENSTNKDEIVLDPFMGSGTTALAALQLGRKYIGFEISQEYFDIANKRIAAETSQLSLF